jgi:ferrous iron transport protein A
LENIKKTLPLSSLKKGQGGIVTELDKNETALHLMEMGIFPGEHVYVDTIAPLGDPISVKVGSYLLSIRKIEAASVLVEID